MIDGTYQATLSELSFRSVFLDEPLGDLAAEVDCVTLEGGSDASCGIIFGVNETGDPNENDQHFFFVKGNQYGMQTTEGGNDSSWAKSHRAVNGTAGSTNLLRVIRQGSEVRLYVNDILVDRFELSGLASGGVGFATSADENNAVVRIDNFRIWDLES
ncbi:MAG: hypothetical protein HC822_23105 [Oscillochloris sp.]|nr:hypothetical protein [Oscillochloris sp.]